MNFGRSIGSEKLAIHPETPPREAATRHTQGRSLFRTIDVPQSDRCMILTESGDEFPVRRQVHENGLWVYLGKRDTANEVASGNVPNKKLRVTLHGQALAVAR